MDRAQALAILARYTPELDSGQRSGLLEEHTVTRQVSGAAVELFDPYAAAVAHVMNPATVKARTEGSVSETYIDPVQVVAYLQGESTRLRESWPAADVLAVPILDLTLDVRGW